LLKKNRERVLDFESNVPDSNCALPIKLLKVRSDAQRQQQKQSRQAKGCERGQQPVSAAYLGALYSKPLQQPIDQGIQIEQAGHSTGSSAITN